MTGIQFTGEWTIRPASARAAGTHSEPQNLIFECSHSGKSVLWQHVEDKRHPAGWGMEITGTRDSVWLAGGDAHCVADSRVFDKETSQNRFIRFNPNHRGDWVTAIRSGRQPTMPLREATLATALTLAGEAAWKLKRMIKIDLTTLRIEDEEAAGVLKLKYRDPWMLPEQ
jgi:hypothetical protein